jgi:hypothetical protein
MLEEFLKLFASELAIAKNLGKKPGTDCLARVDRHDGRSAVLVPQEMMTPLHAHDLEPSLFQHPNKIFAGDAGQNGHAWTVTR